MRATTIFGTLALATTVFAAPVARPFPNGDIEESNPMDPEGDLAVRDGLTVSTDTAETDKKMQTLETKLQQSAHSASERIPKKITVGTRDLNLPAGLPTSEITDELSLEQLEALTSKLPVDTDTVTEELPIDTDTVTKELPVGTDAVTDELPVDVLRRGTLSTLLDPLTSTLNTLVEKFSTAAASLTSASKKLYALTPAYIASGDAALDSALASLASVKPEVNKAIDTFQSEDFQGLLAQAKDTATSKSAQEATKAITQFAVVLGQLEKDADYVTGLGVQSYIAKAVAVKNQASALLAKVQSVSGFTVPL